MIQVREYFFRDIENFYGYLAFYLKIVVFISDDFKKILITDIVFSNSLKLINER